ncbi:hypothetical protein ADK70_30380 [Streptomyces rimosus subsp. pseudoverticillatus]|nr:hypothetical protein ADK70_30380 [Streptomyces rimosus subsp. pseudoverticillatus]
MVLLLLLRGFVAATLAGVDNFVAIVLIVFVSTGHYDGLGALLAGSTDSCLKWTMHLGAG